MKNFSLKINWMSIVMLLSLGINFFVIGYFYAQHKAKEIRMTRLAFDKSISKLVEPFPRSGKREFYLTMRSKRDELIPIYHNIIAQRSTIMTIIAQEKFDEEKLRNAMQEYRKIYYKMVIPSQEVMIKIIGDLELEERRGILERFKNPPKKQFRSRKGSDDRSGNSNNKNHQRDW
ncbi:MAG: hypothetical protein JKY84_10740 [Emcibacteraceae bacterium]|nr:hypothetical protein [Emcibacteraceae bacterium]